LHVFFSFLFSFSLAFFSLFGGVLRESNLEVFFPFSSFFPFFFEKRRIRVAACVYSQSFLFLLLLPPSPFLSIFLENDHGDFPGVPSFFLPSFFFFFFYAPSTAAHDRNGNGPVRTTTPVPFLLLLFFFFFPFSRARNYSPAPSISLFPFFLSPSPFFPKIRDRVGALENLPLFSFSFFFLYFFFIWGRDDQATRSAYSRAASLLLLFFSLPPSFFLPFFLCS